MQCPFDALRFRSPRGDLVTPEGVRRFELNLLGSRVVRADREESLVSSEMER